MKHKLATYTDNYKRVLYCKVCGTEDQIELYKPCPGKIVDKSLDTKKEPN